MRNNVSGLHTKANNRRDEMSEKVVAVYEEFAFVGDMFEVLNAIANEGLGVEDFKFYSLGSELTLKMTSK